MRNIPNLIIPGFPKSGTSTLFNYLGQHKDVFASFRKEPHIYTFDDRFLNRFDTKDSSHSFNRFYGGYNGERYIIDASTTYLISPIALKRIYEETPDAKLIILARDPIERVFSHFNWLRMLGVNQKPFKEELFFENKKSFNPNVNYKGNYKNYIEFSLYGNQIERCFNLFDKKNIYIVSTESFKHNFENSMKEIFKFLDIKNVHIETNSLNLTPKQVSIKRSYPKIFWKFFKKTKFLGLQESSIIFSKKLEKINFGNDEEQFVFNFLKEDLEILAKYHLIFPEWKTVNKYINES